MAISNAVKRLRLTAIWLRAKKQGVRLRAALEDKILEADDLIQFGGRVTQASGNGSSMSIEGLSGLPLHDFAAVLQELLSVYTSAVTELGVDEADDADQDIHDRMLLLLGDKRERSSDFSQLCTA